MPRLPRPPPTAPPAPARLLRLAVAAAIVLAVLPARAAAAPRFTPRFEAWGAAPDALRARLDWTAEGDGDTERGSSTGSSGGGDVPSFCKAIARYPQPYRKKCLKRSAVVGATATKEGRRGEEAEVEAEAEIHRGRLLLLGAAKCRPDVPMMFGQYGEDYYLYTRHFSKMREPGVYLDVAANECVFHAFLFARGLLASIERLCAALLERGCGRGARFPQRDCPARTVRVY